MKTMMMALVLLVSSVSAQAGTVFNGQVSVGPFLNCSVQNPFSLPYQVVSIQYNFSCMNNMGGIFNYAPLVSFNNISSWVYPGQVQTFPGPTTMNCRVVAASCTVYAQ